MHHARPGVLLCCNLPNTVSNVSSNHNCQTSRTDFNTLKCYLSRPSSFTLSSEALLLDLYPLRHRLAHAPSHRRGDVVFFVREQSGRCRHRNCGAFFPSLHPHRLHRPRLGLYYLLQAESTNSITRETRAKFLQDLPGVPNPCHHFYFDPMRLSN